MSSGICAIIYEFCVFVQRFAAGRGSGQRVLPWRSNIPKISEFVFSQVDETYVERAKALGDQGHAVVGGDNYGQGSSREHAVIAPRYLGLRVVVAKSYARIHWQNLANFGVLGLEFVDPADYDRLDRDDVLRLSGLHSVLRDGKEVEAQNVTKGESYTLRHRLSPRQLDMLLTGGLIPAFRVGLAAGSGCRSSGPPWPGELIGPPRGGTADARCFLLSEKFVSRRTVCRARCDWVTPGLPRPCPTRPHLHRAGRHDLVGRVAAPTPQPQRQERRIPAIEDLKRRLVAVSARPHQVGIAPRVL